MEALETETFEAFFINHFFCFECEWLFRERESLKMHHNIDQYLLKLLIQIYDGREERKKKKITQITNSKNETKETIKEIIRSGAIIPINRKRCLCRLLSYIIITIMVRKSAIIRIALDIVDSLKRNKTKQN